MLPTKCPVLGIPLSYTPSFTDNTPTLDRLVPRLGYVPGNVIIVSMRANRIRSDATTEELRKIYHFYRKINGKQTNPTHAHHRR